MFRRGQAGVADWPLGLVGGSAVAGRRGEVLMDRHGVMLFIIVDLRFYLLFQARPLDIVAIKSYIDD